MMIAINNERFVVRISANKPAKKPEILNAFLFIVNLFVLPNNPEKVQAHNTTHEKAARDEYPAKPQYAPDLVYT